MTQPDLFKAETSTPLVGLSVQLPGQCQCGAVSAEITAGHGPHAAGLRCAACGKQRGWLSREAHRFVAEVASKFGRPPGPIVVRTRNLEIGASAPTTAPQGAGEVLTSSAPATEKDCTS
jgi:hypothetical protein